MIWLIGSQGMLGKELSRQFDENGISWVGSDSEVDISNPQALDSFALSHDMAAGRTGNAVSKGKLPGKITWVINCAAFTDMEASESDPEKAYSINSEGPKNVARACRHIGAKLIHFSTSMVFDGSQKSPYTEESVPNPLSIFARSKLKGDEAVQKEMTTYYILRTSWLYGSDGSNFLTDTVATMNREKHFTAVNDQYGSPTSVKDLAAVVIKIILNSDRAPTLFGKKSAIPYGIYNYSSQGEITWYDFAAKIYNSGKKHMKILNDCDVSGCYSADLHRMAKEPSYSVLSTAKIQEALSIKIPKWEESLERMIKTTAFQN